MRRVIFCHLKKPLFQNHRWLQHNHPGGLACYRLQSGFRLLPGAWGTGPTTKKILKDLALHVHAVGPRGSVFLPSLGLNLLAQTSVGSGRVQSPTPAAPILFLG